MIVNLVINLYRSQKLFCKSTPTNNTWWP